MYNDEYRQNWSKVIFGYSCTSDSLNYHEIMENNMFEGCSNLFKSKIWGGHHV